MSPETYRKLWRLLVDLDRPAESILGFSAGARVAGERDLPVSGHVASAMEAQSFKAKLVAATGAE